VEKTARISNTLSVFSQDFGINSEFSIGVKSSLNCRDLRPNLITLLNQSKFSTISY